MAWPFACNECDLGRTEPGLQHCPECGEVTDTYRVEPDDGQVWRTNGSGDYLGVFRPACFDGDLITPSEADKLRKLSGLQSRKAA